MSNKRWHELPCYIYDDGFYIGTPNPLHEKLNEPLCNRLEQVRNKNGWSMKEFAIRSSIPLSTLRNIVNGCDFPLLLHFYHFAAMTGMELQDWKDLCVDGYRRAKCNLIDHPKYFMSYKKGGLIMIERHKP